MNITLNNAEIETALVEHIATKGLSVTGKSIQVHLTAGRGPNGHSASIEILDAVDAPTTATVTAVEDDAEPADSRVAFD